MFDALVVSDLHLGSDNCQADELVTFLEQVRSAELPARRLILNGDVFDSIDFRRLRKPHWKVLSLLRKLSDRVEITWINGNHDGPAEIVSHLLGVGVSDEIILDSGGKRVLLLHGHRFDEFLERYPLTTALADAGPGRRVRPPGRGRRGVLRPHPPPGRRRVRAGGVLQQRLLDRAAVPLPRDPGRYRRTPTVRPHGGRRGAAGDRARRPAAGVSLTGRRLPPPPACWRR